MTDKPSKARDTRMRVVTIVGVAVVAASGIGIVVTTRDPKPMVPTPKLPTAAERAAQEEAAQRTRPHTVLEIEGLRGLRSRDGESLLLSGAVTSAAKFDVHNPTIRCLLTANHVQVGTLVQTVKGVVPASGRLPFNAFNVGPMEAKVTGFNCRVAAAELASAP